MVLDATQVLRIFRRVWVIRMRPQILIQKVAMCSCIDVFLNRSWLLLRKQGTLVIPQLMGGKRSWPAQLVETSFDSDTGKIEVGGCVLTITLVLGYRKLILPYVVDRILHRIQGRSAVGHRLGQIDALTFMQGGVFERSWKDIPKRCACYTVSERWTASIVLWSKSVAIAVRTKY